MKLYLVVAAVLLVANAAGADEYLPPPASAWATHTPTQEGFDAARLKVAIDFAVAHEAKLSPELDGVIDQRDQRITIPLQFAKEPLSSPIGPLTLHAAANGIIVRHGYIVAEWGD